MNDDENVQIYLFFSPVSKQWIRLPDLPGPGRCSHVTAVIDNTIILMGGHGTHILQLKLTNDELKQLHQPITLSKFSTTWSILQTPGFPVSYGGSRLHWLNPSSFVFVDKPYQWETDNRTPKFAFLYDALNQEPCTRIC